MPATLAPSPTVTPADWTPEEWEGLVAALTRRKLLGGGLALGLLTACGGAAPTPAPTAGPNYPREVADALGTTRIPTRPTRIATVSNTSDLDAVLALDVAPVHIGVRSFVSTYTGSGTTSWEWHEQALARLGAQPARVSISGNVTEPPIEQIAAARPDLIIHPFGGTRDVVEKLGPIAPVLTMSLDWRRNLRMIGQAVDKLALAERLITETDQKIARALDGLGLDKPTVTLAYPDANGTVRVPAHPADARVDLFQRAGFVTPPAQAALATADNPLGIVSTEQTRLLDADLIVLLRYQPAAADAWLVSPLAQGLTAVQRGRILRLDQGAIAQGIVFFGPLNADAILPTIRQAGELVKR